MWLCQPAPRFGSFVFHRQLADAIIAMQYGIMQRACLPPQAERDLHPTLVNAQRAGQAAPSNLRRQNSIQPASRLNSSLRGTQAGRVNF
eukprot:COSAG04_NODE_24028_length_328_cov_0.860262_1_plen_88_part_01